MGAIMLVCSLIAQLLTMPLPHVGEAHLQGSRIEATVGRSQRRPSQQDIASADLPASALALLTQVPAPATKCRFALARGPRAPLPSARTAQGNLIEDGIATIFFSSVTFSKRRNSALVAWNYWRGPLSAGSHFAILRLQGRRWKLVADWRYGPIS